MRVFKQIFFTGGGSGGHVVPALTLIDAIKKSSDINIYYVGGKRSVERELVRAQGLKYYAIQTGKLRRYFSIENMIDFFRFIIGIVQSLVILFKYKKRETLIFSTGGFVGLPLVIAAGILGFPVFIHEQTSRVGLANKIASYFAEKVFISFLESKKFFPEHKIIFSGYPLKDACFTPKDKGFIFENIKLAEIEKPILLITGGGNGSKLLNDFVTVQINSLTSKYFVIHQVGQKFIEEMKSLEINNYHPVAFADQIIEIMKHADLIISRAGAGTVMELMALQKTSVFVPLKIAQKNEQYHNAMEASKLVGSAVVKEDDLNKMSIDEMFDLVKKTEIDFHKTNIKNGTDIILKNILG